MKNIGKHKFSYKENKIRERIMTNTTFAAIVSTIKGAAFDKLAETYRDYSRDWDDREEAKVYDGEVKRFASAVKDVSWANSFLKFCENRVSEAAEKYVEEGATAERLKDEALKILHAKAENDECNRIETARATEKEIEAALKGQKDSRWCDGIERVQNKVNALDKTVFVKCSSELIRSLQTAHAIVPDVRAAMTMDEKIAVLSGMEKGERFWERTDSAQKDYAALSEKIKKYCLRAAELDGAVKAADAGRKELAAALDKKYGETASLPVSEQKVAESEKLCADFEKAHATVKSRCKSATKTAVTALLNGAKTDYAAKLKAERDKAERERIDRENRETAAKTDKAIKELCSPFIAKSSAAINSEAQRLKVDSLAAECARLPDGVKAFCTMLGLLDEAQKQVLAARAALATELDGQYKKCNVSKATSAQISEGRAFISKWKDAPEAVLKLCVSATKSAVENLSKFFNSEENRIADEQERVRRQLQEEKEREDLAARTDKKIADVCAAAVREDKTWLASESNRVTVDNLKAECDKLSSAVKGLLKHSASLDKAIRAVEKARREAAAALDAELKRVSAANCDENQIAAGRAFVAGWSSVPAKVKAFTSITPKMLTELETFYVKRELEIAAEREAERKRMLDNDIDAAYARAKKGDADAMFRIAECYYTGDGVTRSYKEAFGWYEKAAKKGHTGAMEKLGDCYYYGYGVGKNFAAAEKWYKKASK